MRVPTKACEYLVSAQVDSCTKPYTGTKPTLQQCESDFNCVKLNGCDTVEKQLAVYKCMNKDLSKKVECEFATKCQLPADIDNLTTGIKKMVCNLSN